MVEYLKHDWHEAFCHKRLCYRRAMAGTFILNLLFRETASRNAMGDIYFCLVTLLYLIVALLSLHLFLSSHNRMKLLTKMVSTFSNGTFVVQK